MQTDKIGNLTFYNATNNNMVNHDFYHFIGHQINLILNKQKRNEPIRIRHTEVI